MENITDYLDLSTLRGSVGPRGRALSQGQRQGQSQELGFTK